MLIQSDQLNVFRSGNKQNVKNNLVMIFRIAIFRFSYSFGVSILMSLIYRCKTSGSFVYPFLGYFVFFIVCTTPNEYIIQTFTLYMNFEMFVKLA